MPTTPDIYTHLTADAEPKVVGEMDEIFRPVAAKTAETKLNFLQAIDFMVRPA